MKDFPTPPFLIEWLNKWRAVLGLQEPVWDIRVAVVAIVNDDPDVMAMCFQDAHLNLCTIHFRHDVEENEEWETYAVHELLHVAHSRVDSAVRRVYATSLDALSQSLAFGAYEDAYEPFVHALAVALVAAREREPGGE